MKKENLPSSLSEKWHEWSGNGTLPEFPLTRSDRQVIGRVVTLFALVGTLALLSQANTIPVSAAVWLMVGIVLGFLVGVVTFGK